MGKVNLYLGFIGVIVIAVIIGLVYRLGYNSGKKDELFKWKEAESVARQEQQKLVASLNDKIKDLEKSLNDSLTNIDNIKVENDKKIDEIEEINKDNDVIFNGNINRLHNSFTESSN